MANINNKNVAYVETDNNSYIFDNNTSYILPFSKEDKNALDAIANNNITDSISQDSISYVNSLIKCGVFIAPKYQREDIDNLEKIYADSMGQLILMVTKDCNLRCSYCIFGDNYHDNTSLFEDENMTFDTAKKAVEMFYKITRKKRARGVRTPFLVTFYGGEPLLNFELVKQVVSYCESKKMHFYYGLTTNGTLLNDEISDFLISNNFALTISLDGDKPETDRKRINRDGKGVYDLVYKNAKKYSEKSKDTNSTLNFSGCYDYKTNLGDVVNYFNQTFGDNQVLLNQIDKQGTTYYDQFSDVDYEIYKENTQKVIDDYISVELSGSKNSYNRFSLFTGYSGFKSRAYKTNYPVEYPCNIGSKLTINADGDLYICEKACFSMSIGHIDSGFDNDKIQEIYDKYKYIYDSKCQNCNISRLCKLCFAHTMKDDDNISLNPNFCIEQRRSNMEVLKNYCRILEVNEKAFEVTI